MCLLVVPSLVFTSTKGDGKRVVSQSSFVDVDVSCMGQFLSRKTKQTDTALKLQSKSSRSLISKRCEDD